MNKQITRLSYFILLLLIVGFTTNLKAQCASFYNQDVLLTSQIQVDAFCGCSTINGNLRIGINEGNDIQNLLPLDGLKEVTGEVFISYTQLTDLNGLGQLKNIGQSLVLHNNSQLKNVDALNLITDIKDDVSIFENGALENLYGLANLKSIENSLSIDRNPKLANLYPFANIKSLGNNLVIRLNDQLRSLEGLMNLKTIGGGLSIISNNSLAKLQGLDSLMFIGGLIINENPVLEDCCRIAHLVDRDLNNGIISGIINIESNPIFCNSIEEIISQCQPRFSSCNDIQRLTFANGFTISNLNAPNVNINIRSRFSSGFATETCTNNSCTYIVSKPGFYDAEIELLDENNQPFCREILSFHVLSCEDGGFCNIDCDDLYTVVNATRVGQLFIQGLSAPRALIEIFDSNRQLIHREDTGNNNFVRVEHLLPGNYFIKTQFFNRADELICTKENIPFIIPPYQQVDCNEIEIVATDNSIMVNGLTAASQGLYISDDNGNLIYSCYNGTGSEDFCPIDHVIDNLTAGIYTVNINQYNEIGTQICRRRDKVAIPNSNIIDCSSIQIIGGNQQIELSGLVNPRFVTITRGNTTIFDCRNAECEETLLIENLELGTYTIDLELQDDNFGFTCTRNEVGVFVTENQVITEDCANIKIESDDNQLSVTGLTAPNIILQVFDENYTQIFRCQGGNCGNEQIIDNLSAGTYLVGVQFYTANWESICSRENINITIMDGDGGNNGGGNNGGTVSANCNDLTFTPTVGQITVEGLNTAFSQVQIIGQNTNWQVVTICQRDCDETQIIPNLTTGEYSVKVQLNATDGSNCYREEKITIGDTPPPPTGEDCEGLDIFVINSELYIQGLTAPIEIVQVFDQDYKVVFRCQGRDCGEEQVINNLELGTYFVGVQFYTSDWGFICAKDNIPVTIESGEGVFCDESEKDGFTRIGNVAAKAFYLSHNPLPIADARQACIATNSRLATSLISEEIDFIKTNIQNEVFIDLSDATQEGNFQWDNERSYEGTVFDNTAINDFVFIANWSDDLIATNDAVWKHFVCEVPCAVSAISGEDRTTNFTTLEKDIKLFPNPVQSEINLQVVSLKGKKGSIKIHNIYGQLVQQFDYLDFNQPHLTLAINNFENGLYVLSIQAEKTPLISKRFVIEHWK